MKRQDLLKDIQKYFKIYEFVGKWTYKIHKKRAWKFFSSDLLECVLIIRENLNKPMTINDWYWGGKFSQRGLRTVLQQIVRNTFYRGRLYLSAHLLGEAIDFDVKGMTADEVRNWIVDNATLFPCKIRLEQSKNGKNINWVHLDTFWEEKNPKVYLFKV